MDKVTLDILSKKKVKVIVLLITDENESRLTKTDVNKLMDLQILRQITNKVVN